MNKFRLLISILLISASPATYAQDSIFLLKKKPVVARVLEITDKLIIYKKEANADGPTYRFPLQLVRSVKYANGDIENFTINRRHRPPSPGLKLKVSYSYTKYDSTGTNMLSTGLGVYANSVIFSYFSVDGRNNENATLYYYLGYEKTFARNRIGLALYPFIGLNRKSYGFRFAPAVYLKNRGRGRVGIGPEFKMHVQSFYTKYNVADPYATVIAKEKSMLTSIGFFSRMSYDIDTKWIINMNMGLGGYLSAKPLKNNKPDNWHSNTVSEDNIYFNGQVGVGYRF